MFSNHSSNLNLEDNMSVAYDPLHTSLDDGALFDQLDVLEDRLKYVVICCALYGTRKYTLVT